MSKVLITGGCGYIGSHTIVDLTNHGFECISVDNYLNSDPEVLVKIEKLTGRHIYNYPIDLVNREDVESIFKENEISGIIHFAALKAVGESVEKPLLYYRNNINGMINLMECAVKYNVKNIIFSSSCTVYGEAKDLPVTEDTPVLRAESPYGYSKQVCERIIEDSVLNKDMSAALLRYFNPAGAHESNEIGESPISPPLNLVPIITEVGIGNREKLSVFGCDYNTRDGSCIRDYIHVMDLANAHTRTLQHLEAGHVNRGETDVFNLGTGEGTTVLEAIQAWEEVSGQKLNYEIKERRLGDVPAMFANFEKAKKILGWTPQRGIKEIMQSAWAWEKKRKK